MPALIPTDFTARITWLGQVSSQKDNIRSAPRDAVEATWAGVEGECHGGVNRRSCVRVKTQYPEGTEIRNVRQFSIVSAEEMAAIAAEIGLDALRPEWLGASMVVEGIEDFTHLPPSSRLQNGHGGPCLVIDMANRPCVWPGKELEKDHPGLGKKFKPAAAGRRGVTAWVEYPGPLRVGDELTLHVPDQRAWTRLEPCLTGKLT